MDTLDAYACTAAPLLLLWAGCALALAWPVRYDDDAAQDARRRRMRRVLRRHVRR